MKKRYLCQACLGLVLFICILYAAFGEKAFPTLGKSRCEELLTEGKREEVKGRVYRKAVNGKGAVLYIDRLRAASEEVEREKVAVYLEEGQTIPEIGQYVSVAGKVRFFQAAPNPGNFDQRFYYQKQRIYAALYQAELRQTSGSKQVLRESLWRVKMRAQAVIYAYLGEEHGEILCSMLLGEAASDDSAKEWYQKSGIGHILAISGLHVSVLGIGLYRLLRKIGCPVNPAALAGSIVMCLYAVMVGAGVSAVRAVVMFLFRMGAYVTGREYDGLTALSAAAVGTLILNPLQLFDAGFQLSYGAVLGIYALGPAFEQTNREEKGEQPRRLSGHMDQKMSGWYLEVRKGLGMSLAIHVVTLPIMLYYYYELCTYSFVWNLAAIPLASVILGCGIGGVLLGSAAKGLHRGASVFFGIADWGIGIYDRGSEGILSLPGSRQVTGQPQLWQIAGYLAAALTAVYLIGKARQGGKREQRVKERAAYALKKRRLAAAGGLLLVCAAGILTFPEISRGNVEIVMLNVGQGDCFFIRGPKGGTYLIDGGSSGVDQVGRYRLEPFLKSRGVGRIDYVWISHGDVDHINGIAEMLSREKVGVAIDNLVLAPREVWDERIAGLAALAREKGTRVLTIRQGRSFTEGDMTLSCLWPMCGEGDTPLSEAAGNEASMVLSLTYGEFDMLFTGDLEKEGEAAFTEWLCKKQEAGEAPEAYEVLKVGHHGSRFATGEELLRAVRPAAAWISAGEGNLYGHPHPDVLERLANWGVNLYNTKDGSAVKLCTDGKKYCILRP